MKKYSKFKDIDIKMKAGYSERELGAKLDKIFKTKEFDYEILKKSLDARNKKNIHWLMKIRAYSNIFHNDIQEEESLVIPYNKRNEKVVVVGSGPAGFFSAYVLAKAGFGVSILERGNEVPLRFKEILDFEAGGSFKEKSNYSFGEGGAGTFSDGKLTSRSKKIPNEKKFIFESYVEAGAPEEILYLSKPHIGSDILRKVAPALRKKFIEHGGEINFGETVVDIRQEKGRVKALITENNEYQGDWFIFATGHSAFDAYRLLGKTGVNFRTKSFAIGVRAEHRQSLINISQWGVPAIQGVKAAEYKLTHKTKKNKGVYSFCMCPGGKIVPATSSQGLNIVNGVSNYERNSPYANSGIVVGIHPDMLGGKEVNYLEALDSLETLEKKAYEISSSYGAAYNNIGSFLGGNIDDNPAESSYPFELIPYDFSKLLPPPVIEALKEGFSNFARKIRGYEQGSMIGIETKTSSPIQVLRAPNGLCDGFANLFFTGEGSGYAGGIVSSGADGIKAAMSLIER